MYGNGKKTERIRENPEPELPAGDTSSVQLTSE